MRYIKPHLTFEKQADLLLSRGMQANKKDLVEKLKAVNYYRLSGYWYIFKQNRKGEFKPNTTLKKIWNRYTFDRHLRLLIMDSIERVEVAVRTSLIYHHSYTYGPFGYVSQKNLPAINKVKHNELKRRIKDETNRSKEVFVKHFYKKYGDKHTFLPAWMLAEIMSFGMMLTFFRGCDRKIKKKISKEYSLCFGVLESWLLALNTVRNICAHHGRLWNRTLGYKPKIPEKDPKWHNPIEINKDKIFCVLTILKYMINFVAPQSKWDKRFKNLLEKYPGIPVSSMGMPKDWSKCPIW